MIMLTHYCLKPFPMTSAPREHGSQALMEPGSVLTRGVVVRRTVTNVHEVSDVSGSRCRSEGRSSAPAKRISRASREWTALLVTGLALLVAGLLPAFPGSGTAAAGQAPPPDQRGTLSVLVVDSDSNNPLSGAWVRILQSDRIGVTDSTGRAEFRDLPARPYTVVAERVGYMPGNAEAHIEAGQRTELELELSSSPIEVAGIMVTGTGRQRGLGQVYNPTTILSGIELQRNLASSVPASLRSVPGFAVQYNGPGAASPTIRGMGGDRVLMLEDGQRTGDLYQTASDHGVMVEPLSAERMEVVRGPAGLLYGSNALGGVVNVIRNDVPRSRPSGLSGTVSSQLESVNSGIAGGAVLTGPLGPLVYRVEGTGRTAGDSRTPLGSIPRTDLTAVNAATGLSWVDDWGFAGVAGRWYGNRYGVPGEFGGELIPGGHPGGVDIEVSRLSGRVRAMYQRPVLEFFSSVEMDGNITRYDHDEIEGLIGDEVVFGARFSQTTIGANLTAHHEHQLHDHPEESLRAEGAVGISVYHRDLTAGGTQPGTRSGTEWAAALFGYEEFSRGPVRLQVGGRYDRRSVTPASLDSIVVRTRERRVTKPVEARTFGALSGSVALLWDLREEWTLGASVARSFRTPAIEELYSDGPHLADFSFDIGSPDLDEEVGLGFDLFLRGQRPDLNVELAAFFNQVSNYIVYLQTGELIPVFREGVPPRETPVFEARGEDSQFLGAEGRIQWEVRPRVVLDGTASYTRATRRSAGDPLPFIPPLSGRVEARYEGGVFFGSVGADWSAAQHRIPGPIPVGDTTELPQLPTGSHFLMNLGVGARLTEGSRTHTFAVEGANVTNRKWRDHLSRIKDVAPQPGLNVQFTYRVHF
jgi:iron complex outermembrane recepter protein